MILRCMGHDWKEEHFTQVTISGAKSPVTPADEAMMVVFTIENCEKKWKIEHGGKFPNRKECTNPKDQQDCTAPLESTVIDKDNAHHKKFLKKFHKHSGQLFLCEQHLSRLVGGWRVGFNFTRSNLSVPFKRHTRDQESSRPSMMSAPENSPIR